MAAADGAVADAAAAQQGDHMRLFVTVGTTRFDSLIRAVLSNEFLDAVAQLAPRSSSRGALRAQLTVQYGNSSIADILTSSALASVDEGSEIVPEPGLRIVNGRRVYQSGPNIAGLDPGMTGKISGLRLRTALRDTNRPSTNIDEARSAGKGIFESMLDEAKAMQGLTSSAASSALQGAALQAETEHGIELNLFQFAPDIKSYIQSADVVISHAGSGTILDTLRMRPETPALVVVPNTSLMDNHQVELAEALGRDNFLIVGSEETLTKDVARARTTACVAFPDFEPARFAAIVDDAMGF
ncbi:UDP-N-acetylglucosamine transferase subunit ALG13 [Pseudozyma hubeiensis]|nr:UDP-N-acetylglucosamine transferase subunit ALG13 [Pseudozyma hubeiensis]